MFLKKAKKTKKNKQKKKQQKTVWLSFHLSEQNGLVTSEGALWVQSGAK